MGDNSVIADVLLRKSLHSEETQPGSAHDFKMCTDFERTHTRLYMRMLLEIPGRGWIASVKVDTTKSAFPKALAEKLSAPKVIRSIAGVIGSQLIQLMIILYTADN